MSSSPPSSAASERRAEPADQRRDDRGQEEQDDVGGQPSDRAGHAQRRSPRTGSSDGQHPAEHLAHRARATACSAGSRSPRPASSWVTMCTSIVPESCTTRVPTPSTNIRASRERREVPSTSWVALAPRAKSSSAVGTSSPPTTVWKLAPTSSASRRSFGMRRRPGRRPARRRAARARRADRPRPTRLAIRAARRSTVSLSGSPVSATTTRSRVSQTSVHVLLGAVALQRDVDLVGHPQQRQLAQRGEVARLEVVGERGVDLLGGVDVAVREPAPQRLGGDVDQLELLGAAHDLVGHGLPLPHTGDPLDDVVERLEVLDVHRGRHVDAGVEQLLDVLPALGVPRAGRVGVGELVDEHDLGLAGEHRVEVHLVEPGVPPTDRRGTTSSPASSSAVLARPWVSTSPTTTSVPRSRRRWASPSMAKVLPDARRRAEVDAQLAASGHAVMVAHRTRSLTLGRRFGRALRDVRSQARSCGDGEVQLGDVDRRARRGSRGPARRWPASTSSCTRSSGSPVTRATRATCSAA